MAAAAAQHARSAASGPAALDQLTALVERCLLADLGGSTDISRLWGIASG